MLKKENSRNKALEKVNTFDQLNPASIAPN